MCEHSYDLHVHMDGLNSREMVETSIVNDEMKKKFESAESEEALGSEMKQVLDKKYHKMEEEVTDLLNDLENKINFFEAHASTPSYLKLLDCQLKVVAQRIITLSGLNSRSVPDLIKTKEDLEKKISLAKKFQK